MNLRKFSQQSYFKQKTLNLDKNDIIKEEQEETKTSQNLKHKKCITQTSASSYIKNTSSQCKKKIIYSILEIQSFISSTSPQQKYKIKQTNQISTVSQFTIDNKQIQSQSEQQEAIGRLLRWGKKKEEKIKEKQEKYQNEEKNKISDKPELSKETIKIYESGLKHHFELNSFIKFKHQFTQISNDYQPLVKFEKLKKGKKVIIENEEEIEDKPQNFNDKTTQYKLSDQIQFEALISSDRKSRNKSDYTSIPIHLRYEYEIKLKNAKLKQMIDIKEKAFQQELAKKHNSTAEQFEHFLSEQENFLKKKQQFYDANLKKELEKIQEIDSQFSYKPEINFPPISMKAPINQNSDEKFNEKLHSLGERQQKQKQIYFFRSTLPDLKRKPNPIKYNDILHKRDNLTVSQIQFQTES
ncbi:unnamed protein product [Paramecium sonneborni]|uniref:Uncharacterized protein n=1 Tax=Paramecium sonneborni TaxID=65129 RepID=A0A8S1PIU3_9CILI|nr:unnamed protein product [Paramecium sonneborni]